VEMWLLFLIILCIGKIAYNASLVVYDGMLIDVAENEEMDMLSVKGYSWRYIGSCIPFALCLVVVVMSDFIDLLDDPIFTAKEAMIISLIITGAWWVLLSTPLFKNYEQRYYRGFKFSNSEEIDKIKGTLRNIL
jgi:UMF1 family MFS transporter